MCDQTPIPGVAVKPLVQTLLAPLQYIPVKPCAGKSKRSRRLVQTLVAPRQSVVAVHEWIHRHGRLPLPYAKLHGSRAACLLENEHGRLLHRMKIYAARGCAPRCLRERGVMASWLCDGLLHERAQHARTVLIASRRPRPRS